MFSVKRNIPIIVSLVVIMCLCLFLLINKLSTISIVENVWKFFLGGIGFIILFSISLFFILKLIKSSK
ncbi:hypothetical protein SAMN04488089_10967 [Myroides profundi]|uniref:Uncharacterized protein n=1 Tax=Myroides profundi TaxID=480520 RepID=A0AAJ4W4W2_MYRPR|nr:hypothetical protein SAMN04488089_10967 [Myroides profundi]